MTHSRIRYSIVALMTALAATGLAAQTATPPESLLARPNGAFFALSVADAQRMAAWYRDELGLSIVSQGEAQQGSIR
jgi:catechol-2,3-dioxygenase